MLEFLLGLTLLGQVRFRDGNRRDDNERNGKHGHGDEEQRSHVAHGGLVGYRTDEHTHEERGKRSGQRVEGTTGLNQLVTFVTATTEQVQHGVYHGVEHTYAETADEGTQQIDNQVQIHLLSPYGEESRIGTHNTRQILNKEAHETYGHSRKSCFLVTDFHQHRTRRYTHKQIGQKVHHVTHHAGPRILVTPDKSKRCRQISDESNHCKQEHHCDNGNNFPLVFLICTHFIRF